jgi:hypothetical protein
MAASFSETIGRTMGIPDPMLGISEGKSQSGIALYRQQIKGTKLALPMMSKFAQTRQQLYDGVCDLIRYTDIYSEDEIIAIADEEDLIDKRLIEMAQKYIGPPPQPPKQPNPAALQLLAELDKKRGTNGAVAVQTNLQRVMEKYQKNITNYEEILRAVARHILIQELKSIAFGKYGSKVSSTINSETTRLAMFQMMLEARKSGIMIPDDLIIEQSDWPNKEKIVERLRAMPPQTAAAG